MSSEELLSIDLADLPKWNVRDLVLKATVHVNAIVASPAAMSESLNGVEFVPFGRLSVVNLKRHHLADLVGSTTNNHHKRSKEQSGVLVARHGTLALRLVRSLDPVPSSVAMSSEAPSVKETRLISGAATEADHHTGSATSHTQGG